ncbi:MAG: tRNA-dihydrouridine synthase family protein [Akkermansiaceae bacterium]|nr:tRNA-dihydrouridine synthase family protein [Akkermansiaceae bacterium]
MHHTSPTHRPALVLAPMQDVTDLPFMRVIARRGAPDWFVTEYFRVHPHSRLEQKIVRSITENQTQRPVYAQMIGQDIAELVRTARELERLPVAGIDINLGCPAPVVCRKNAGGGLLRQPEHLNRLLGELRGAVQGCFTVKTRVGFEDASEFESLLELFSRHAIDGLSIHGRTVRERYQTPVHADCVRMAVETLDCPVIANGNVVDVDTGLAYLEQTSAAGLMVGRGAIRNPWIFSQLAAAMEGREADQPELRDLLAYIEELYEETARERSDFQPLLHVQAMKRTLAYISHGLEGSFEHEIRRARAPEEFFAICRDHLERDGPLPARPPTDSKLFCGFEGLLTVAKPVF